MGSSEQAAVVQLKIPNDTSGNETFKLCAFRSVVIVLRVTDERLM